MNRAAGASPARHHTADGHVPRPYAVGRLSRDSGVTCRPERAAAPGPPTPHPGPGAARRTGHPEHDPFPWPGHPPAPAP
jgi:hypothetical protein